MTEVTFTATHPSRDATEPVSIWLPALGRALPVRMRPAGGGVWTYTLRLPAAGPLSYVFVAGTPVRLNPVSAARLMTSADARREAVERLLAASFVDPANPNLAPAPYGNEGLVEPRHLVSVLDQEHGTAWTGGRSATGEVLDAGDGWQILVRDPGDGPGGLGGPRPLVVVLDGEMFGALDLPLPHATVAYVINPPGRDRMDGFTDRTGFVARFADRMVPLLRERYDIVAGPEDVTLVGASIAAVGAVAVAIDRPDVVGNVVALSGSFWWGRQRLLRMLRERTSDWPVRVVLTHGALETITRRGRSAFKGSIDRFAAAARGRAREVIILDGPGGHDVAGWRGPLTEALTHLVPGPRPYRGN